MSDLPKAHSEYYHSDVFPDVIITAGGCRVGI